MPEPKFQRSRLSGAMYRHFKEDPLSKNQRDEDIYVGDSGMPKEELFPADGRTLNIGDPYNVIDLPNVVNIDMDPATFARRKGPMVKAMFPILPFKDKSFKRIVSSWAVGYYEPTLGREETSLYYQAYFEEINRLLDKEAGVAYLWPHSDSVSPFFLDEAKRYISEGGAVLLTYINSSRFNYISIDDSFDIGSSIINKGIRVDTCVIFPKGASPASIRRVTDIISKQTVS